MLRGGGWVLKGVMKGWVWKGGCYERVGVARVYCLVGYAIGRVIGYVRGCVRGCIDEMVGVITP